MGYHRPISGWNIGKKQEYADRKYFKEPSNSEVESPNISALNVNTYQQV